MKKKLEAELITIAHRILKLKNRADIVQLQQETLKLYEKLSVLKFVEDNFGDVKPTISYASAEQKLDEIYGIEEMEPVHANEVEAEADKVREEKDKTDDNKEKESAEKLANVEDSEKETDDSKQDKENDKGEGVDNDGGEDEASVSETEKEITEEKEEEPKTEDKVAEEKVAEDKKEAESEPEVKVQVEKPEEDIAAMEESAAAVFEKEQDSTSAQEDKAIDAEVVTIAPDANAKVEDTGVKIDFAFEREPAPEEPKKVQKEITFEDFHDYKEPEFIRKDQPVKPKEETKTEDKKPDETATPVKDWRDWEPSSSSSAKKEEPKEEPKVETKADPDTAVRDWRDWEPAKTPEAPKKEEPKKEEPKPEIKKSLNDMAGGKVISLGLNDRIAFEKNLFAGSGEDLNRVLSQLNTFNSLSETQNFIEDLVKPDYNNWNNKEEYEERFMAIVEKRFE